MRRIIHLILPGAALLCELLVACIGSPAHGAPYSEGGVPEYAVKAAYLMKFGEFVVWPPDAFASRDAPFVIGVLGEDPFGAMLDQIAGARAVQGRPVTLRRFTRLDQVRGANVLYISPSERDNLPAIIAALGKKSTLTVSDADIPGVMINFVLDHGRIRFDINRQQAERAGLKISSKLLAVARTVKDP